MARRRGKGFMSALRDLIDEYDDDEDDDEEEDKPRGRRRGGLSEGDVVVVRGKSARSFLERLVGTTDDADDDDADDDADGKGKTTRRKADTTPKRRGYFGDGTADKT